jgi:GNAT superfamily N-acetyltransferase
VKSHEIQVRPTQPTDFAAIEELCRMVYPESPPWTPELLGSTLEVFPAGQLVAMAEGHPGVVGIAASLIVTWDDYTIDASWRDMTAGGSFANHDPTGHTLYGAEVMVHPAMRRRGVGRALYQARRELVRRLRLRRIRAGARLRGYHRVASRMTAEEYVQSVVRRELEDPTLTFQLKQHFRVLAVVSDYLKRDPESLGYAAVIEWINYQVARPKDYAGRDPRYGRRGPRHSS